MSDPQDDDLEATVQVRRGGTAPTDDDDEDADDGSTVVVRRESRRREEAAAAAAAAAEDADATAEASTPTGTRLPGRPIPPPAPSRGAVPPPQPVTRYDVRTDVPVVASRAAYARRSAQEPVDTAADEAARRRDARRVALIVVVVGSVIVVAAATALIFLALAG